MVRLMCKGTKENRNWTPACILFSLVSWAPVVHAFRSLRLLYQYSHSVWSLLESPVPFFQLFTLQITENTNIMFHLHMWTNSLVKLPFSVILFHCNYWQANKEQECCFRSPFCPVAVCFIPSAKLQLQYGAYSHLQYGDHWHSGVFLRVQANPDCFLSMF